MSINRKTAIDLVHALIAVSLVVIGLAKLISWLSDHRILDATDPIVGLEYRYIYPPIAVVEMGVGLRVIRVRRVSMTSRALLLTWLGACFACYRTAAYLVGYHGPCPCLGSIFDLWPVVARKQDPLLIGLIVLLCSQSLLLVRPFLLKQNVSRMPIRGPE